MRIIAFCFLFLNLTNCFLIPRLKINQVLKKEDCQNLGDTFLYDLSFEDLKKSLDICMKKNKFNYALKILTRMQDQMDSLVFLEKRAVVYTNLEQYEEAIQDYQKILQKQHQGKEIFEALLDLYIKNNDFEKSLKTLSRLLDFELPQKQVLELEFIQARLFLLLYQKEQARSAFLAIREKDLDFFNFKQGSVYLALLSEQDKNFLEAIEELKQTKGQVFEDKILHWQSREKNKPQ